MVCIGLRLDRDTDRQQMPKVSKAIHPQVEHDGEADRQQLPKVSDIVNPQWWVIWVLATDEGFREWC